MVGGHEAQGEVSSRQVRLELTALFRRLRERHPVLQHQDAIGATIFSLSAGAIVLNALLYLRGTLPAWAAVPIAAIFMSILHELEHDLIHRLYFRRQPLLQDAMMLGVWLFRPSTVNPWLRRDWHLHHHKFSGTDGDFEERSITNGESWGLRRLLMTADGVLAFVLRPATVYRMTRAYLRAREARTPAAWSPVLRKIRLAYVPLGLVHFALWYAFLALHCLAFARSLAGAGLDVPSPWFRRGDAHARRRGGRLAHAERASLVLLESGLVEPALLRRRRRPRRAAPDAGVDVPVGLAAPALLLQLRGHPRHSPLRGPGAVLRSPARGPRGARRAPGPRRTLQRLRHLLRANRWARSLAVAPAAAS